MADQKISQLTELTTPATDDEFVVVDKSDTTMAASGTDKRIQHQNLFDWAESGDLSTIEPDDAAAAGSSVEIPRADHKHPIATGAPSGIQGFTAAGGEGTSTSFARADHNHANPWNSLIPVMPSVTYVGAAVSTATGVANTYYAVPVLILGPVTVTGVEIRNGATTNGNLRAALYDALGVKVADRTTDLAQAGSTNSNRQISFTSTYVAIPGIYYMLVWFSSATATAFMAPVQGVRASTGTNATTTPTAPGTLALNTTAPVMSLF